MTTNADPRYRGILPSPAVISFIRELWDAVNENICFRLGRDLTHDELIAERTRLGYGTQTVDEWLEVMKGQTND